MCQVASTASTPFQMAEPLVPQPLGNALAARLILTIADGQMGRFGTRCARPLFHRKSMCASYGSQSPLSSIKLWRHMMYLKASCCLSVLGQSAAVS